MFGHLQALERSYSKGGAEAWNKTRRECRHKLALMLWNI